jgi:hypothetical protein
MCEGPGRKPTVEDVEILDVFRTSADPVLTATEVSEQLPLGRRGILKRLRALEDEGTLKSKEVGSGSRVWWYPGHTETQPDHHLTKDP